MSYVSDAVIEGLADRKAGKDAKKEEAPKAQPAKAVVAASEEEE